jgi:hypothetical protein
MFCLHVPRTYRNGLEPQTSQDTGDRPEVPDFVSLICSSAER